MPNMIHHTVRILPTLCLGILLLISCGQSSNETVSNTPATPTQDTVAVFVLHTDTLKKSVDLPGELQPYLQTDLYAKVQGYVRPL